MSKKILTRIICFVLVAIMTVSLAVSCTKPKDPAKDESGEQTTASTEPSGSKDPSDSSSETNPNGEYDPQGFLKDKLPADLKFPGEKVNILAWGDVEHPEFDMDEYDPSSVIDKALHDRIIHVEERLGIDICFNTSQNGDSDELDNWVKFIQLDTEGDHEFQAYAGYSLAIAACASKGYCYDLNSNESRKYLNFDMPWWPERLITEGTVKNHLYFASGDISNNALYMMYTCFVNNDLLEEYELENPQTFVESGKWTYDKFFELAKDVYKDQNGDGEKNAAKEGSASDVFGYMTSGIHVDPWFYGTGAVIVEKDKEGNLIPSPSFQGEAVTKTVEKLNTFLNSTNGGIYTSSVWHQKNFRDGNLLFCIDRARIAFKEGLLSANENLHYSVVPCPKYDEKGSYVTVMGNPFTLYAIPSYSPNEKTVEIAAATLEALASESYRTLSPAVFEVTFKLRYAQDPVSANMFDIIKESLTFDIGRLFSDSLIGQTAFRNAIKNSSKGWAATSRIEVSRLKTPLKQLQLALCGE